MRRSKKKSISNVWYALIEKKIGKKLIFMTSYGFLRKYSVDFFSRMLCTVFFSLLYLHLRRSSRTIAHSHADSCYLIKYQIKCNYIKGCIRNAPRQKKVISFLVVFYVSTFFFVISIVYSDECTFFTLIIETKQMLHLNHGSWHIQNNHQMFWVLLPLWMMFSSIVDWHLF